MPPLPHSVVVLSSGSPSALLTSGERELDVASSAFLLAANVVRVLHASCLCSPVQTHALLHTPHTFGTQRPHVHMAQDTYPFLR